LSSLTGRLVPFFLEVSFACTLAFCLFGFLNPRNSIHIVSSSASIAADLRSEFFAVSEEEESLSVPGFSCQSVFVVSVIREADLVMIFLLDQF
jgi:hypothetical protein